MFVVTSRKKCNSDIREKNQNTNSTPTNASFRDVIAYDKLFRGIDATFFMLNVMLFV